MSISIIDQCWISPPFSLGELFCTPAFFIRDVIHVKYYIGNKNYIILCIREDVMYVLWQRLLYRSTQLKCRIDAWSKFDIWNVNWRGNQSSVSGLSATAKLQSKITRTDPREFFSERQRERKKETEYHRARAHLCPPRRISSNLCSFSIRSMLIGVTVKITYLRDGVFIRDIAKNIP